MSRTAPSPDSDLSLPAAAAVAGLCEKTIRRKIDEGQIGAFKVGRSLAIPRGELDRFLEARRVPVVPRGER